MSLLEAVWLIILSGVVSLIMFILAMAVGAAAEWLVMRVKDYAAHR